MERYRAYSGSTLQEETWTLHLEGIAQVDTKTVTNGNVLVSPTPLVRYQYNDHLGSATLETNEQAELISYEEYHPFGTTAYSTYVNGSYSTKRYRFSNKERDDETGLYYFGVRYYAAWLGRWTSSDPADFIDGLNLYRYVRNNPVNLVDADGRSSDPPDDENTFHLSNCGCPNLPCENSMVNLLEYEHQIGQKWNIDSIFAPSISSYISFEDNSIAETDVSVGTTNLYTLKGEFIGSLSGSGLPVQDHFISQEMFEITAMQEGYEEFGTNNYARYEIAMRNASKYYIGANTRSSLKLISEKSKNEEWVDKNGNKRKGRERGYVMYYTSEDREVKIEDISSGLYSRTATSTGAWTDDQRNYFDEKSNKIQVMTGHTHGKYSIEAFYFPDQVKGHYNMKELNKPTGPSRVSWQDYNGMMNNSGHPAIIATPFGYTINSTVTKGKVSNYGIVNNYSGKIIYNYNEK